MSSVAARINPGPGLTKVVSHLRDVRASALTDIRDPAAQQLMLAAIDAWIALAEEDRDAIETAHTAGLDVAKTFRVPLPTPAATRIDTRLQAQLTVRLRQHQWLSTPHGSPATYRAQRGDVLMYDRTHRARP